MTVGAAPIAATGIAEPVGTIIFGTRGSIGVSGGQGAAVGAVALLGVSGVINITGGLSTPLHGSLLQCVTGSITVIGKHGALVHVPTAQAGIFDLVNVALNEIFPANISYVLDGETHSVDGTFTDVTEMVTGEGEIISTAPMVTVRCADMPLCRGPAQGDEFWVDGRRYIVWEWDLDDSDAFVITLKAKH